MQKILEVPFRFQKSENSCFPACISMVLKYYGTNVKPEALYKKGKLPGSPYTWDAALAPFVIGRGYNFIAYWNGDLSRWKIKKEVKKAYKAAYKNALSLGMKHKRNATVSLIKKYIDKGVPVLTTIRTDKFYSRKLYSTHLIVIIGYDNENFYYHDPDKMLGGKNKKINFDQFKKSWLDLGELSKRCIVVIMPKALKGYNSIT